MTDPQNSEPRTTVAAALPYFWLGQDAEQEIMIYNNGISLCAGGDGIYLIRDNIILVNCEMVQLREKGLFE